MDLLTIFGIIGAFLGGFGAGVLINQKYIKPNVVYHIDFPSLPRTTQEFLCELIKKYAEVK